MLYAGMTDKALELLVAQEQNFPGDRALALMHAAALVQASRYDEALAMAQGVCDAYTPSCAVLPYLGYLAVEMGDTEHAGMFARAAEGRLPGGYVWPDQSDYAALDRAERERAPAEPAVER
jgi:Flp pilus assembly protein TadD